MGDRWLRWCCSGWTGAPTAWSGAETGALGGGAGAGPVMSAISSVCSNQNHEKYKYKSIPLQVPSRKLGHGK